MQLNVDAIQPTTNISDFMMIQQLQQVISRDDHLQQIPEITLVKQRGNEQWTKQFK